jgi:hypothetical protein
MAFSIQSGVSTHLRFRATFGTAVRSRRCEAVLRAAQILAVCFGHSAISRRNSRVGRGPAARRRAAGGSPKKIRAVRCPTCGAAPRENCVLTTGLRRTEPHRDRRLMAKETSRFVNGQFFPLIGRNFSRYYPLSCVQICSDAVRVSGHAGEKSDPDGNLGLLANP